MKIKNRKDHDCLTMCVAKYFGLNDKRVPFFVKYDDYGRYLRSFYKRRGLRIDWEHFDKKLLRNKRKLYIVVGLSPRGKRIHHAVLYKGTKPFYDPNESQEFLRKPLFIWMITKIRKKK